MLIIIINKGKLYNGTVLALHQHKLKMLENFYKIKLIIHTYFKLKYILENKFLNIPISKTKVKYLLCHILNLKLFLLMK